MSKYANNRTMTELTPQQIAKIVQLLDDSTKTIDEKTLAQLAASRKQAAAVLQNPIQTSAMQVLLAGWRYKLDTSQQRAQRFWAPALVLLAILAGVFGSNLIRNNTPINTDSLVLASELPPEAFADKEFVAWLEHTSRL